MSTPVPASRTRAFAVLAVVVLSIVALLAGLLYLLADPLRGGGTVTGVDGAPVTVTRMDPSPAAAGTVSVTARQDALAAAPMLSLPASAAQPQPLVAGSAGPSIELPAPAEQPHPGGAPVPTGFPHSAAGALAQLAAIDEAALSTTDLDRVGEVYAWAALPGAVGLAQWSPAVGVRSLVAHLGGPADAARAQVAYRVVQGQIKGSVGEDFVVACVLGQLDVSAVSTARAGVGDCQRMVWRAGRWWIGPGAQPAYPPHAWPGSADAVRAGWREVNRA